MGISKFLIASLFVSSQAFAISDKNFKCLVTNVYLEGRGLHNKEAWSLIAATALNRSNDWEHYHYGAKSPAICDIAKSKQYTSAKALNKPIHEVAIFEEISNWLKCMDWMRYKTILYFKSDKSGNMFFSANWTKDKSNQIKLR
jgi:hypothetical protein